MVIPKNSQNRILDLLHDGHFHFQHTINQAREKKFGPKMTQDIQQKWQKCIICQQNVRSKLGPKPNNFSQNKATQINPINLEPVDILLIDWCHISGSGSGFIWAKQSAQKNTKQCLKILKHLFLTIGFATIIQSDNTGKF